MMLRKWAVVGVVAFFFFLVTQAGWAQTWYGAGINESWSTAPNWLPVGGAPTTARPISSSRERRRYSRRLWTFPLRRKRDNLRLH